MKFWTPTELATFLKAVEDDELYPLFRLAALTGLRRGEVCALRWAEVDLDKGQIHVRRQLTVVNGQPRMEEHPKSDHGRRTVDIDAATVAITRRHRTAQLERRMIVGAGWRDGDLVFCGAVGEWLHPEYVTKAFFRRARAVGLPAIRFHDLRHTHCAALIAANRNPREISRRLGHATVAFTLDRYGHLLPEAGAEAAAAVAALVDGTGS
jgi:integrase